MDREIALAKAQWEKKNVVSFLDNKGISYPNPHYVKKELIDSKIVETMPNIPKEVEEELWDLGRWGRESIGVINMEEDINI